MNLIINASDAIGDRNGEISITTGAMEVDGEYLSKSVIVSTAVYDESPREGHYVFLEVADTGCGMDEATQKRIFEPFFTTKATGRGLGMATILGIIRSHSGAIKIDSAVDKGTTIRVMFAAGEAIEGEGDDKGGVAAGDSCNDGLILFVDDDVAVRDVGVRMLERLGFTVLTANDGHAAVETFRERSEEIQFVLMDLSMPKMDGLEAYREIHQIRPDAKVILCSGYDELDTLKNLGDTGPAGFLQKPYRVSEIRALLHSVLSDGEPGPQEAGKESTV